MFTQNAVQQNYATMAAGHSAAANQGIRGMQTAPAQTDAKPQHLYNPRQTPQPRLPQTIRTTTHQQGGFIVTNQPAMAGQVTYNPSAQPYVSQAPQITSVMYPQYNNNSVPQLYYSYIPGQVSRQPIYRAPVTYQAPVPTSMPQVMVNPAHVQPQPPPSLPQSAQPQRLRKRMNALKIINPATQQEVDLNNVDTHETVSAALIASPQLSPNTLTCFSLHLGIHNL